MNDIRRIDTKDLNKLNTRAFQSIIVQTRELILFSFSLDDIRFAIDVRMKFRDACARCYARRFYET